MILVGLGLPHMWRRDDPSVNFTIALLIVWQLDVEVAWQKSTSFIGEHKIPNTLLFDLHL